MKQIDGAEPRQESDGRSGWKAGRSLGRRAEVCLWGEKTEGRGVAPSGWSQ